MITKINAQTGEVTILLEDAPSFPAVMPTTEQIIADYQARIDLHIDAVAQQRQYRDGVRCASYVTSTNALWAAEAAAFVAWRDAVWTAALAMLAAVQAGGAIPESPIAGLPEMEWPA